MLLITIPLLSVLALLFTLERRRFLLPDETSDGHHLIEQSCSSCHRGFEPVRNEDCESCHRPELAQDTHPTRVFEDPRWAEDLEQIDALLCTTCHAEHAIAEAGVTVSQDFCFLCHDDVVDKRPTHADLTPTSCGNAGCHNYHDNTGLNTAYLAKRANQPDLLTGSSLLLREVTRRPFTAPTPTYPDRIEPSRELLQGWAASAHAASRVGCQDCHVEGNSDFVEFPSLESCGSCHAFEAETFHAGKHGVRTALQLSPLEPLQARVAMASPSQQQPSHLSCSACHDPHSVDTAYAATQACLNCHADQHSLAFEGSPHARLSNLPPRADGSSLEDLTCATCHLPRMETSEGAEAGELRVAVHHNNTFTLWPADRMVKMVCASCHGLEFSLSSILDEELILNNFEGRPAETHPTFPMVQQALANGTSGISTN